MTGITKDRSNGREEEVEVDLGQVDEIKDNRQRGNLGLIYVVEVLLGKIGEGRVSQNNCHQHDTTERPDSFSLLEELSHVFLAQSIY